jgi:hypothetical protein
VTPQRIGELVLVAAAIVALALVLILTSFASVPSGSSGPATAQAADCIPVEHTKAHIHKKKVRRHGKKVTKRRKHIHRWTTCEPPPPVLACAEPSSVLGVTARDDMASPRYTLSRPCVTAGEVDVELNNQGEDPHHVFLRPAGMASVDPVFRIPDDPPLYELPPGEVEEATLTLTAGDWYLWCDLLTHEQQGMYATLQVR